MTEGIMEKPALVATCWGKGGVLRTKPWFSRCVMLKSKAIPEVRPGQVGPGP